jgi:phosphatidylserine decarboxylase
VTLTSLRDRVTVGSLRWAPTAAYSTFVGATARRAIPGPLRAPLYRAFARAVGVALDEVGSPLPSFRSFGDFFARTLVPGARPIDDAPLVSPCDGAIGASGAIERGTLVQAKGHTYRLAEIQYGRFERILFLPSPIDPEQVTATSKNGFLEIRLTKRPVNQSFKVPIANE